MKARHMMRGARQVTRGSKGSWERCAGGTRQVTRGIEEGDRKVQENGEG
jgi:hypothetical protein